MDKRVVSICHNLLDLLYPKAQGWWVGRRPSHWLNNYRTQWGCIRQGRHWLCSWWAGRFYLWTLKKQIKHLDGNFDTALGLKFKNNALGKSKMFQGREAKRLFPKPSDWHQNTEKYRQIIHLGVAGSFINDVTQVGVGEVDILDIIFVKNFRICVASLKVVPPKVLSLS